VADFPLGSSRRAPRVSIGISKSNYAQGSKFTSGCIYARWSLDTLAGTLDGTYFLMNYLFLIKLEISQFKHDKRFCDDYSINDNFYIFNLQNNYKRWCCDYRY